MRANWIQMIRQTCIKMCVENIVCEDGNGVMWDRYAPWQQRKYTFILLEEEEEEAKKVTNTQTHTLKRTHTFIVYHITCTTRRQFVKGAHHSVHGTIKCEISFPPIREKKKKRNADKRWCYSNGFLYKQLSKYKLNWPTQMKKVNAMLNDVRLFSFTFNYNAI